MICQNCQEAVDNDLIFCTNCGERLSGTQSEAQTVLMNDSNAAKNSPEKKPKSSSNIKWITLIVALIAIPASLFGVYLLMNPNNSQTVQNPNKTNSSVQSPTRKTNSNQNTNLDSFHKNTNSNANISNANQSNVNSNRQIEEKEIINERIEIAPKTHYAKPFEIEVENAKIIGEVEVLQGENVKGFVYLQTMYDEHFPDATYKVFDFAGATKSVVDATLVKEKYVLVFVNDSEKSIIIKSKISIK